MQDAMVCCGRILASQLRSVEWRDAATRSTSWPRNGLPVEARGMQDGSLFSKTSVAKSKALNKHDIHVANGSIHGMHGSME